MSGTQDVEVNATHIVPAIGHTQIVEGNKTHMHTQVLEGNKTHTHKL